MVYKITTHCGVADECLVDIPAKPLRNHDQFQYILIILLYRDLRQTKEGLRYVHLLISQCG